MCMFTHDRELTKCYNFIKTKKIIILKNISGNKEIISITMLMQT